MKIVVIGGTGLIGSKVVEKLKAKGHEAIAAAPNTGVNTITGECLIEALRGARVVVDVANSLSFEDLHKSFKPFCTSGSMWPDKANAAFYITNGMQYLADTLRGDYLFGDRPTVADFYLFVTLRWAAEFGVETPERLLGLRARLEARPAVQAALAAEGLR